MLNGSAAKNLRGLWKRGALGLLRAELLSVSFATEKTVVIADAFVFRQMNAAGRATDHIFQRLSLTRSAFAFAFNK